MVRPELPEGRGERQFTVLLGFLIQAPQPQIQRGLIQQQAH